MIQIYCDLDGVLADFDQHHEDIFGVRPTKTTGPGDVVDWDKIRAHKNFFGTLPQMKDMRTLWTFLLRCHKRPIILTKIPKYDEVLEAAQNKREWVDRHLGTDVHMIACQVKDEYCKPGDILIDDWDRHKKGWLKAGGVWITHTSAESTIIQLTKLIREGRCPWTG